MPELRIEDGPARGRLYTFDRAVVLGRGDLADVMLDDVTVSRRHARIHPREDGWVLEDLGSANGSFVNQVRVAGEQRLQDGDRVTLGQLAMAFSIQATRAAQTPLPDDPGSALFQDMLSRIRLFVDLGELSAQRAGKAEEHARRALAAVLQGLPRIDRAAVFVRGAVGEHLGLLAQATRDGRALQPTAIAPVAHEAQRHQDGLLLVETAERDALTERLKIAPLFGAVAALPMRVGGERLGVLYLDSLKNPGALRRADREHLIAISNLLGCLLQPQIDPRSTYEVERHDLTLARRIQQRFLPQAPPRLSGYAIVDKYAAARVIGGDHYDFLGLADGRACFVVADVSGKALSGALYMARLGAVLKQAAGRARSTADLLEEVNRILYAELEAGMFVTMLAVALEPRSGSLEIAAAGHPAPLARRGGGSVVALESPGGPPLGAMSEPGYGCARHALAPGELLLLYTDGLDEAHAPDQTLFGMERIQAVLARATSAQEVIDDLGRELASFVGTEPQSDDLTIICIQRS